MMQMGDYNKARLYYSEAIDNIYNIIYGDDDPEESNSHAQTT
jgi:hypothetical protein